MNQYQTRYQYRDGCVCSMSQYTILEFSTLPLLGTDLPDVSLRIKVNTHVVLDRSDNIKIWTRPSWRSTDQQKAPSHRRPRSPLRKIWPIYKSTSEDFTSPAVQYNDALWPRKSLLR